MRDTVYAWHAQTSQNITEERRHPSRKGIPKYLEEHGWERSLRKSKSAKETHTRSVPCASGDTYAQTITIPAVSGETQKTRAPRPNYIDATGKQRIQQGTFETVEMQRLKRSSFASIYSSLLSLQQIFMRACVREICGSNRIYNIYCVNIILFTTSLQ